jgi:methylmalonyl-CoA mutase C-terminal domain/subunit
MNRPIRVLVAKVGLDGHDRGAKVIATALRDAGMEVIYTGLRQTPEMVVQAALQEDTVFPRLMDLLKKESINDILLTGGGIIPDEDMQELSKIGVGKLFPPGSPMHQIADYIKEWVSTHRKA